MAHITFGLRMENAAITAHFQNLEPSKRKKFFAEPTSDCWTEELTKCRYSIRVGKSSNVGGPFVDKSGKKLLQGGGTVVYASNHGNIFAPGGPGVVPASGGESQDILVYHYRKLRGLTV